MAEESSPQHSSTRWIETSRGILTHSQLAPFLAERVLRTQEKIETAFFDKSELDENLLREMHRQICGDLTPDWAGSWRKIDVRVGSHSPPPPNTVPMHMRDYIADLSERTQQALKPQEIPELLAFAEGRLLTIHPFVDFNGRVTRLWIWELLRRNRLPPVNLAPMQSNEIASFLAALRAADSSNFLPLVDIWKERFRSAGNAIDDRPA